MEPQSKDAFGNLVANWLFKGMKGGSVGVALLIGQQFLTIASDTKAELQMIRHEQRIQNDQLGVIVSRVSLHDDQIGELQKKVRRKLKDD